MAAEKIRIYELAKNLELSNKEVMDLLDQKLKITAKSHASTISKEDADKLASLITKKPSSPVPQPKVINQPKPESETTNKPDNSLTQKAEPQQQISKPAETDLQRQKPPMGKPYGERPEEKQEGRDFNRFPRPQGDRPPMGGGRPFPPRPQGDRPPMGGGRPYPPRPQGDRPPMGEGRPYPPRPQGDRPPMGEGRPYPPRPQG
ncbi:MAG: translation initiation factor IF-2 N-terminal domain-containing protein, partial [bacterium]